VTSNHGRRDQIGWSRWERGELTGVARVPAISGSGLHVGGDAVLLGTHEGDYEVQRGAASS
jgi:hypothetical protein